jgi:hypothetical protein
LETNANVKESMCTYTRAHSHIRARDTHGIWHFLQFYNFQASLNHRAYACSCCCFIVFHFSLFSGKCSSADFHGKLLQVSNNVLRSD